MPYLNIQSVLLGWSIMSMLALIYLSFLYFTYSRNVKIKYKIPSIKHKSVETIIKTLQERDINSESHSRKVAYYSKQIAIELGFNNDRVSIVETAALVHDVGKIMISSEILTKPERLSKEEFNEIKKHPEIGYRILKSFEGFEDIAEIILNHHERIDGKGYPNKIKGDNIPIEAKIISVADSYEAMISTRTYKNRMNKKEAISELYKHSGTQFDLKIVDIFVNRILK